jgi:tetratricopeptide (TPR) repeat protein
LAAWHYFVDTQRMSVLAEQSLALCKEAGDRFGIAYSLLLLGEVACRQEQYEKAQALIEHSLTIGEEVGARCFWCDASYPLADLLRQRGEDRQAAAQYEVAVAKARAWRDPHFLACGLVGLSNLDLNRAMTLCEQVLAQVQPGEDPLLEILTRHIYACLLLDAGELAQAQALLERVLVFWNTRASDIIGRSTFWKRSKVVYDLGRAACLQGDLDRAAGFFAESLRLARDENDRIWISRILIQDGYVPLVQQAPRRAAECLRTSFDLWRLAGSPGSLPLILAGLAEVAFRQGNVAYAAQMYGAAAGHGEMLSGCLPSERVGYDRLLAAARLRLDDPVFAAAWAEGQTLTVDQAVALALASS